MKIATINIWIFCLVMVSCKSNKELDREEAFRQIKEGRQYPKVIDYDIYCGDPQHEKKFLMQGLRQQVY